MHVWSPAPADGTSAGVTVHALSGGYLLSALRALDRQLDACPPPRRLFVQWVPHGYGYKSLNIPFCFWVRRRASRGDSVELMVHEPFLPFEAARVRQNVGAAVHRGMLAILLSAAERVWVSTTAFLAPIERFGPRRRPLDYTWLPVPSPITPVRDDLGISALRAEWAGNRPLVGYFGTASPLIAVCLADTLQRIVSTRPDVRLALVGVGTASFARDLVAARPALAGSIATSGERSPADVSRLLQCCDLFVQPYPDGLSTRRTTLMALLQHGRPVVANVGPRTEPVWVETNAVQLVPSVDAAVLANAVVKLMDDQPERRRLSEQAARLYESTFDVRHTLAALMGARAN